MPRIKKISRVMTREQMDAIAELSEEQDDVSRARGPVHEVDLVFTESDQGIKHLYVKSKVDNAGCYHIAKNGNVVHCEAAF